MSKQNRKTGSTSESGKEDEAADNPAEASRESPEPPRRIAPYEGWLGFGKDRVQTGRSVALVIFAVVMIIGVAEGLLGDKLPLTDFLGTSREGNSTSRQAPKTDDGSKHPIAHATARENTRQRGPEPR